jgi:hypothetical protein
MYDIYTKYIKGVKSASFVSLVSLDPLPDKDYNFFGGNFTNHIPAPHGATAVLAEKFKQASTCITQVGLSDTAAYTVVTQRERESNKQTIYI